LEHSFFAWPLLVLSAAALGCDAQREPGGPPAPGPVAHIYGRVMRGNRPMAGVNVLARMTYGVGCNVHDSAPGGTTKMMAPTDSTGRFQTTAYPAWAPERRTGCLYVGAVDSIRAETAWAAPRRALGTIQQDSITNRVPVLQIDVPWPE
jgi:hypothetical protein